MFGLIFRFIGSFFGLASLKAVFTSSLILLFVEWLFRVVLGLGFSYVVYKGTDVLLSKLVSYMNSGFSGMSADALNILYMSGLGQGLNIVMSAVIFRVSFQASKKIFFTGVEK